ncbi:MAG: GntR family transcriptional regulator [Pseudomonadota bacterium]
MPDRLDIFDILQTEILEGALAPGDRLKEADVAERFGLSRTPVREALRRLETRGLLIHEPHRGMVVAGLDPGAVSELYAMREILDCAAARLAARHASEMEIAEMRRLVERDRSLTGDARKLAAANRAFHLVILRAAHNRFLAKASDTLAEALALLGPTTLAAPGRAAKSVDEHAAIVDAIADRDGDRAEAAARVHIQAAFAQRLAQMDDAILEAGADDAAHSEA